MNGRIKKGDERKSHLPIIGNIKIGMKNESGYPQSLDYFRCDSKYESLFNESYGSKPSTIQIAFISDDFNDSCDERYECRDSKGKLMGYGDGSESYLYDFKSDKYLKCDDRDKLTNAGKWETILTLKFIVLKVRGVFGLFSFKTKAIKSSLPQIRDTFDSVLESAGTVINIPFDLSVRKVVSQKPGSKYKFPVVSMIPNISQTNMRMIQNYLSQGNDIKNIGILSDENLQLMQTNNQNE